MKIMKIEGRRKKIESDKKVQIIKMYMIFLDYGTVYDYELSLDCSKEKDQATFRRYANELHRVGAIPKVRLKKKIIQNGPESQTFYFFAAKEVKLQDTSPVGKTYDAKLGRELNLYDPRKPMARNAYHVFRFYRKPTRNRLARVLCMVYWFKTRPIHSGEQGQKEIRARYEKLNPGASDKTFQRDEDLRMYALYSYLDFDKEDFADDVRSMKYYKYVSRKNRT